MAAETRPHEILVRRVFEQLDKVSDGRLTYLELKKGLKDKTVDWGHIGLDPKNIQDVIYDRADVDGDRLIGFYEFYDFCVSHSKALSKDPLEQAQAYMENNRIQELFQSMVAALLVAKPEQPTEFLIQKLTTYKLERKPIMSFDTIELQTMFGLFDITGKGYVTAAQVNNAILNVAGKPGTVGHGEGMYDPKHPVQMEKFVAVMKSALAADVP